MAVIITANSQSNLILRNKVRVLVYESVSTVTNGVDSVARFRQQNKQIQFEWLAPKWSLFWLCVHRGCVHCIRSVLVLAEKLSIS